MVASSQAFVMRLASKSGLEAAQAAGRSKERLLPATVVHWVTARARVEKEG
jgi:hypothetical protein